jgi:DNA-binding NarL/FixJ family response regulator
MHHFSHQLDARTDLATLWHELCARAVRCVEIRHEAGRCFAVLEKTPDAGTPPSLHLRLLERRFAGESQKCLAVDLGVSASTVSAYAATTLSRLGYDGPVSRTPILFVMASLAAQGFPTQARLEEIRDDGRWVLSVRVPGESFKDRLSHSELQVALLSIEGFSHGEIARLRGSSTRTVANQLASAFRKLGVSGRSELRAKAVRESPDRCVEPAA